MTEVRDEFIKLALELSGSWWDLQTFRDTQRVIPHAARIAIDAILAFAQRLQDHAAFRQEVSDAMTILRNHIDRHGGVITTEVFGHPDGKVVFANFILPKPDPDEELARGVADSLDIASGKEFHAILATITALRAAGRITDA